MTVRRNVKDSVFSDFFSDKKNMLKMYRTLHPEDTEVTEDDVEDITIKNDELNKQVQRTNDSKYVKET